MEEMYWREEEKREEKNWQHKAAEVAFYSIINIKVHMITIKKNQEYKSVYNTNDSISDFNLVLFLKKNNYGYNRFGFTAAKKIKKAVSRNLIRRRLKEIVRLNEDYLNQGYDIILMARVNATDSDYISLEKSFKKLIKRKKLVKGD